MFNIMDEVLVTQGARASAIMILIDYIESE